MEENIYVITGDNNKYKSFLGMLQDKFKQVTILRSLPDITDDSESLNVLFVEYPLLAEVSTYLIENINLLNYILVVFFNKNIEMPYNCSNIFGFINACSETFDRQLFFSNLNAEISNKKRVSQLQSEVREFYEIGKSLTAEKDTIKLFERIINSSMSLTSSDAGTLYLVVDKQSESWSSIKDNSFDHKLLKFVIAKNMSIDVNLQESSHPIIKESMSGYAAITGRPLRIEDAYNINPTLDYCHNRNFDINTGYITKSVLSIPIKDQDNNVMGVIQLINKKRSNIQKIDYSDKTSMVEIIPYDNTDELIMNSLAGQAAVALENNLLYRDMRKLLEDYREQNNHLSFLSRKVLKAHEEERKRIAREIHDGPAQMVSSLALKLEVCKKYLEFKDYEKLSAEMDKLGEGLRGSVKEIRTIIYDLKPASLENGLIQAIESYKNVFCENTGIEVAFRVKGNDEKVEYYMTTTVFRIVQEALSNVFKHAGATDVKINLNINKKDLLLKILDNGKGFDESSLKSRKQNLLQGGFGLEGIRERVELMRGNLSVKSTPGKGTAIEVKMPLV